MKNISQLFLQCTDPSSNTKARMDSGRLHWCVADDPKGLNSFLAYCDSAVSADAPIRRLETTSNHVANGDATVLLNGPDIVASFTLTEATPRDLVVKNFPYCANPIYLQRLAVHPSWRNADSLIGSRCIRKAILIGKQKGCDCIRAEVAEHIPEVLSLLRIFGFRVYGPKRFVGKKSYLSMQLTLDIV